MKEFILDYLDSFLHARQVQEPAPNLSPSPAPVPAAKTRLLPLTNAQRCAKFGTPKFRSDKQPGNPEAIKLLGTFESENIVRVECPQLIRLHRPTVRLHRLAAQPFLDLMQAWADAGLITLMHRWNGSFVPRFKRGRSGGIQALSNHTWGTAFDINANEHPLGQHVPALHPIRSLVPLANEHGWFWGGDFVSRPDGMHFEYVGLP